MANRLKQFKQSKFSSRNADLRKARMQKLISERKQKRQDQHNGCRFSKDDLFRHLPSIIAGIPVDGDVIEEFISTGYLEENAIYVLDAISLILERNKDSHDDIEIDWCSLISLLQHHLKQEKVYIEGVCLCLDQIPIFELSKYNISADLCEYTDRKTISRKDFTYVVIACEIICQPNIHFNEVHLNLLNNISRLLMTFIEDIKVDQSYVTTACSGLKTIAKIFSYLNVDIQDIGQLQQCLDIFEPAFFIIVNYIRTNTPKDHDGSEEIFIGINLMFTAAMECIEVLLRLEFLLDIKMEIPYWVSFEEHLNDAFTSMISNNKKFDIVSCCIFMVKDFLLTFGGVVGYYSMICCLEHEYINSDLFIHIANITKRIVLSDCIFATLSNKIALCPVITRLLLKCEEYIAENVADQLLEAALCWSQFPTSRPAFEEKDIDDKKIFDRGMEKRFNPFICRFILFHPNFKDVDENEKLRLTEYVNGHAALDDDEEMA